jgi:transcriptional regulator with AAA-type ATPase domain
MVNKALEGDPEFAVSSGPAASRSPSVLLANSQRIPALTGVLMTDPKGRLVVRRIRARVASGPDRGRESVLEAGTLLVGSHADNDLVLRDAAIAKYHLEIALVAGGVRVRDLTGDGATTFQGVAVKNQVLPTGCEIALGRSTLQLLAADISVPPVLSERGQFGSLVGQSSTMRELFGMLERVAPTDSPVLLEGESGTGRSTLARAIHNASRFAATPMVVLDFSTPMHDRALVHHLAQRADSYTLLIEHIDRAPKSVWDDLVTVYERREEGVIDPRIIATSDLGFCAQPTDSSVRRALITQATALRVTLPSLAERVDDVAPLIEHFVREHCGVVTTFGDADLRYARVRNYPRNVAELREFVSNALGLDRSARAQLPRSGIERARAALLLPLNAKPKAPHPAIARQRLLDAFTHDAMRTTLERAEGDVALAALRWGVTATVWQAEMERLTLALRVAEPAPTLVAEPVIAEARKEKRDSGVHPTKPARKAATKRR